MLSMFLTLQLAATLAADLPAADGQPPAAAAPAELRVDVNDHRPVAAALDILEQRHGVVITYEDPAYEHPMDMDDVTNTVRQDLDRFPPGEAPKVLVPARGTIALAYPAPVTAPFKPLEVIQAVLDQHAQRLQAGRFSVQREGNRFCVVPSEVLGRDGRLDETTSLLDSPVTMHVTDVSAAAALDTLVRSLAARTSRTVMLGAGPANLLAERKVTINAEAETARSVLVKILDQASADLSWRLFYDPGLRWHVLNLHPVSVKGAEKSPTARIEKR